MAIPTSVNGQITDSVTQVNVAVVGKSPAMAVGSLYQTLVHSLGMAMQNQVAAQQHMNITGQAVVAVAVQHLLQGQPEDGVQLVKDTVASVTPTGQEA